MAIPSGSAESKNVWSFLQQGKAHARKREYESALRAFTDAIHDADRQIRCPKSGEEQPWRAYYEALLERGRTNFDLDRYAEAIHDFDAVVKELKNLDMGVRGNRQFKKLLVRARILRGEAHLRQGKFNLACADFTRAMHLDPRNFEAHFRRGLAWRELGDDHKANRDFKMASQIDPQRFEAWQPFLRPRPLAHPTTADARFRITYAD